jgi:hypothetical protein
MILATVFGEAMGLDPAHVAELGVNPTSILLANSRRGPFGRNLG